MASRLLRAQGVILGVGGVLTFIRLPYESSANVAISDSGRDTPILVLIVSISEMSTKSVPAEPVKMSPLPPPTLSTLPMDTQLMVIRELGDLPPGIMGPSVSTPHKSPPLPLYSPTETKGAYPNGVLLFWVTLPEVYPRDKRHLACLEYSRLHPMHDLQEPTRTAYSCWSRLVGSASSAGAEIGLDHADISPAISGMKKGRGLTVR